VRNKATPAVRADPGYEAVLADVVGLVAAARANLFQAAGLSRLRLDNRAGHVRPEESRRNLDNPPSGTRQTSFTQSILIS